MKEIILEENNVKSFQTPMEEEAQQAIKHFERELAKIRTGRAHTSLVEDLMVSCYGGPATPLKSIASITAPEPRLVTIQPWDSSVISSIESAINASELGLSPLNDGNLIRLQLPQMTTQRRDELLKQLGKKLEECKISIRNIRKEFNNVLRDAKQTKKISENFFNRLNDILQNVTDKYCTIADEHGTKKEKDIKTV
jgi:ribosome recycling factor